MEASSLSARTRSPIRDYVASMGAALRAHRRISGGQQVPVRVIEGHELPLPHRILLQ